MLREFAVALPPHIEIEDEDVALANNGDGCSDHGGRCTDHDPSTAASHSISKLSSTRIER